jgi:hypothetical protein
MKKQIKNPQAGVALLFALLALMVLSAIAVGLVYMTNTETQVNANYRSEQVAYFAAKAGIEEARDRMMLVTGNPYYFVSTPGLLPTQIPNTGNNQILYIINEGNQPAGTVAPWDTTNAYMDDELCHDGYSLGLPSVPPVDIHCDTSQVPTGTGWFTPTTSQLPFNVSVNGGPVAPLAYKWVRVAIKLNNSVQSYAVNGTQPASTPVCWNGATEVTMASTAASCGGMTPPLTQVYLVTALAVSSTGARKLLQADVALNPSTPLPFGLFGTGKGCNVVSFTGNGSTDSFSSAGNGTYDNTHTDTGGSVGANGNVSLVGNANIGGVVAVPPGTQGTPPNTCPNLSIGGANAGMIGNPTNTLCSAASPPANCLQLLAQPVTFQTPPAPVPAPLNSPFTPPPCASGSGACLVPGTYGNIAMSGKDTLTLAPGVYNINSLNLSGQSSIVITPLGQVVLNVAGNGITTGNVIDLSGQSVDNETFNANQFIINYGGNGQINVTGNASSSYFVLNAPNSQVQISGNGHVFGAVVGKTILDVGNGKFSYDKNVNLAPPSTGALNLISFRHIPY